MLGLLLSFPQFSIEYLDVEMRQSALPTARKIGWYYLWKKSGISMSENGKNGRVKSSPWKGNLCHSV